MAACTKLIALKVMESGRNYGNILNVDSKWSADVLDVGDARKIRISALWLEWLYS